MYQADGQTHLEEDDQCFTCEYFCKSVMCPLLEALAVGVAHLEEEILVKNCGFYVEFKRTLTALPGGEEIDPPALADSTKKPRRRRPKRER